MTLLKSVHIYKKHRVQYEIRTYFRFMRFNKLTGSTMDTFLEYIERNLPEGVALKVAKMELQDLPPHIKSAVAE
jgi:small subunit ribosomal protein S10